MKILLPVDGSEFTKRMLSQLAACEELLGPDNEYTVFTAVGPISPRAAAIMNRDAIDRHYREEADKVLEPVRSFATQLGWRHRALHAPGDAADSIAGLAGAGGYDLVVMGTHGHSALCNVLLGSVAAGVLAKCKVPVLLLR